MGKKTDKNACGKFQGDCTWLYNLTVISNSETILSSLKQLEKI